MSQRYTTIERVSDPIPEAEKRSEIASFTVHKKMRGEECQRLLLGFMRRADPTYTITDAEIDYLSDPIGAWKIAMRELWLQENSAT
jgi:hypothetical protein